MGEELILSIRQPWAWLILHAGKDIENRTWPTRVRGRVLIHASKGMTREEWEDAYIFAIHACGVPEIPMVGELERGGIVGEVEITDCVRASQSPWFCGPYGFTLATPKPLPFEPLKGSLGFFKRP